MIDLGLFTADSAGRVHVAFTVPSDLKAGPHHLVLVGQMSGLTVLIPFTVATGRTATSTASQLASTGADDRRQLALAFPLTLTGLAIPINASTPRRSIDI